MILAEATRSKPVFGASTLQDLRDSLKGELVLPGDETYDELRSVFNGMIDRRPALIARPLDTEDVVTAVNFGRSHDLLVSVRGGGHSAPGHGVCHNGLMIDLSLMKGIEIDTERRIATAQPGLRLGEFITETEKFGLVSPTGTVSDTGLAGLTLGGGYGWLAGKYGMAVDNLVGAEVVASDGRVLRASADENPDLFWALRGGSGNFGIVTSFELRLYPVTQVLGGMLLYPFPMAKEVLTFYRGVASTAPDELTTYAALVTGPDGNQAVALALCYTGDLEEGERVIAPLRAFGPPIVDMVRPMPYSEINCMLDAANPPGMQNYWKWSGLRELSDDAIGVIVSFAGRVPSPRTVILIDQLHGAAARVSPDATAFAHRDAPHGLVIISMWDDPEDAEANITWTREFAAAAEPFCTGGVYVNGESGNKPAAAFGSNYERLAEIKAKYDPTNFFRHNQNIKPAS
jgi:FAD/FMN-containing dehydrogenase